ncbi:MAG: hypothetical protein GY821_11120 [Gammaproteobacteria bacterium]|nr:hypothetical protein [Gammaproteobacteria bacterium]
MYQNTYQVEIFRINQSHAGDDSCTPDEKIDNNMALIGFTAEDNSMANINSQEMIGNIPDFTFGSPGNNVDSPYIGAIYKLDFGLIIQPPCPSRQFKKIY